VKVHSSGFRLIIAYDALSLFLTSSGLWPSAPDRKALFDPVMALMGHTSEESTGESSGMQESSQHPHTVEESSGDPGSPQHKSRAEEKEGTEPETDKSLHSAAEQDTAEDENEVCKVDKDVEHPETAGETNNVILYPDKAESELTPTPVIQAEPTGQDVETLESVGILLEKEISEVGHSENSELVQTKSGVIEVDESSMVVPHKLDNVVDMGESMDEQTTQVENMDKQKSQAEELSETIDPVQAKASSDRNAEGGTEPSGLHSASTEETDSPDESSNYPLLTALPSDEASAMVSDLVSPESHAIVKAVEVDQQVNDYETDIKEQQLSSGLNVSDSSDSMLELEKLKREMKMMETALQGAARQSQVFHEAQIIL
jgi:hypothetical protein